MKLTIETKEGCKKIVKEWCSKKNKKDYTRYKEGEKLISSVFKTDNIFLQVCVLDSLYSTNIKFQNEMAAVLSDTNIQTQIKNSCQNVVLEISIGYEGRTDSYAHSFATKYCFHRFKALKPKEENLFVIVDSLVLKQLLDFNDIKIDNAATYYKKVIDKKTKENKSIRSDSLYKKWQYESYFKLMESVQTKLNKITGKKLSLRNVELLLWRKSKIENQKNQSLIYSTL